MSELASPGTLLLVSASATKSEHRLRLQLHKQESKDTQSDSSIGNFLRLAAQTPSEHDVLRPTPTGLGPRIANVLMIGVTTMGREDLKQLIGSFIEAFNRGDWTFYDEILTDDVVFVEHGTARTANGKRRTVATLRGYKLNTSGLEGVPVTWVVDEIDGMVAIELAWRRADREDDFRTPGTMFFTVRAASRPTCTRWPSI